MQTEQLITFILTQEHPTSYENHDGSFMSKGVSRRIVPEYTMIDKDGNAVACRHIRNLNTIVVAEQTNAVFNRSRDNIYFSYGICVLHSIKDKITIEFLRKHPMNEDVDPGQRRTGVFPEFKEAKLQAEGLNEIDFLLIQNEAKSLVLSIQTKENNEYVYNTPKLDFLCRLFKTDATLPPSKKIVDLVQKSQADPVNFMYKVNREWEIAEKEIQSAINHGILTYDKQSAYLSKEPIFAKEEKLNEADMKTEIFSYLLSPAGNSWYVKLKEQLALAVDRKITDTKTVKQDEKIEEPVS